jgi:hypothetical protein
LLSIIIEFMGTTNGTQVLDISFTVENCANQLLECWNLAQRLHSVSGLMRAEPVTASGLMRAEPMIA